MLLQCSEVLQAVLIGYLLNLGVEDILCVICARLYSSNATKPSEVP